MENYDILYMVLKLQKDVVFTDPFTKLEKTAPLGGVAGYVPCFNTYEDAQRASCDGKFQVVEIQIKKL